MRLCVAVEKTLLEPVLPPLLLSAVCQRERSQDFLTQRELKGVPPLLACLKAWIMFPFCSGRDMKCFRYGLVCVL